MLGLTLDRFLMVALNLELNVVAVVVGAARVDCRAPDRVQMRCDEAKIGGARSAPGIRLVY